MLRIYGIDYLPKNFDPLLVISSNKNYDWFEIDLTNLSKLLELCYPNEIYLTSEDGELVLTYISY